MKKLISLLMAFVMLVCYIPAGAFAAETAYYVAGQSGLCGSEWNSGDANNQMTLNEEGLYEKTYENVPAGTYEFKVTDGTWTNSWGSNGNNYKITLEEAQNVIITFNAETKEIKTNVDAETPPDVSATYYVAGTSSLCGSTWANNDSANQMTLNAEGLYEKTFQNVPAGEHEFKITDGTWDNSWGNSGSNYTFTTEAAKNVTITFNAETKEINVILSDVTTEPEEPEDTATYYVAGTADLCGNPWACNDATNLMTRNTQGLYEKTYNNVPAGNHEFKITDGTWDNSWGNNGSNYTFATEAAKNVTITFNAETKEIKVELSDVTTEPEEPEEPDVPEVPANPLIPANPNTTATNNPIEIKVHYTREDGNFDGWDVFQWGGNSVDAFEKVSDTEAIATIYANSNSGDIGFIVRYGGDSWTGREWVNETTGDRMITGLSDIVTGTVHVYVDHANPAETKIELGDDVIKTGDEHINIRIHYLREDGNFEGWDVFQWGGISATAFEGNGTEAISSIRAYSNSGDIGFIVRYGGDSWTDREWVNSSTGDRTVSGLSDVLCGTVDVYVDHANPSASVIDFGTIALGTGEAPEYDITINVHYYRPDGNYADWEVHMWNGVESLSATREFADETVSYDGKDWKVATYYADASDTWVGFIIKTPAWTKDPDGDRHIDISDVTGGTVNVYAVAGSALEDFVTDKSQATLGAKITAAVYNYKTSTIEVSLSYPLENVTIDTFTLEGPDGQMTISKVEKIDDKTYVLTYEGTIDEMNVYTLYYNDVPCVVTIPNTYSTEEFEKDYTYTGNDLGATWSSTGTTFRLWAPTAAAVSVNLYKSGTEGTDDLIKTVEMTADVKGTWVATVEGDLNGIYYTYSVTRKGETVEAVDPYARTTGVNGNRAMVINLDSTDPSGWANDKYVTQSKYTDAVIWELHVRDFSIDQSSGMTNKGKYLAFTEKGTTVPGTGISTGVDYMKELGVNYVHLLPVYDINSVDETTGGYNWGYDPKNYNVPEGSYSTDPYNGAVRVTEFKQMVQALHNQGIGVVMDVVYNHVADAGTFCFNQIVPGYFSRIHDDGSYQSNSGCGNDTASERSMVSKYIVDSVLYWAEEYHIDGFRWDLVGLIDYETINAVMEEVHKVNPNIIFYGEGWEMCSWTTKDGYVNKMTIQPNDAKVNTDAGVFAFFNDTIRNVIHGGVFTATDKGFVSGNMSTGTKQTVTDGYMGNSTWGSNGGSVDTPLQTINYASCHDNYTLFDNLTIDVMDATGKSAADAAEQAADMNNLAAAYYITAQGVPFIHAGEEMLRSKPDSAQENGFNHNSYASGDAINSIKWSTLANELVVESHDYYQGLISFRKAHPALRLTSEATVLASMSALETGNNNVVAILNNGAGLEEAIISIFNADSAAHTVTLPEGKWNVYVNNASAGTEILATVEGEVEVDATSAMILVKAAHEHAYELTETVDPTCTEDGSVTYTCECGDSYTESVPASGHSYETVVTAPTCTEEGFTTYTCACGDTYIGNYVAAHGHNVILTETKDPTCTNYGYEYYACEHCGGEEYQLMIDPTGHSYVGGKCEDCSKKDPATNPPIVNIIKDVVETVVNIIKPTLENIFNKIFWWR